MLPDAVRLLGVGAGLLAAIGLLLLVPLFIAGHRDLRRLRAWRVLEPYRGDAAAPIGPPAALGLTAARSQAVVDQSPGVESEPQVHASSGVPVAGETAPTSDAAAGPSPAAEGAITSRGAAVPAPGVHASHDAMSAAAGPSDVVVAADSIGSNAAAAKSIGDSAVAGPVTAEGQPPTAEHEALPVVASARPPLSPAERVTGDRPALSRITGDMPAVEPDSGVHRAWARLRESRHPLLIAGGALLVGAGIFVGALQLLGASGTDGVVSEESAAAAKIDVTVLNATGVSGLESKVADDIEANGFTLGSTGVSEQKLDRTQVLFADGQRGEARDVADALGVENRDIQPLSGPAKQSAEGADVVVIAGDDRARL